jgi:hypothetical protein
LQVVGLIDFFFGDAGLFEQVNDLVRWHGHIDQIAQGDGASC